MENAGYIVLQGGAEFNGQMKESDLRAIELAGGMDRPICIIPTAAAPDRNHDRAGANGQRWFTSLGARNVFVAGVIDHKTAEDPLIAEQVGRSGLIYLLGGFPAYLADVLKESACWKAMRSAWLGGAVLCGSSAGAMVLCRYMYDPAAKKEIPGLDLLAECCVLPHHNTFGRDWAPMLQKDLRRATLIGIDERTGMVNDGPGGDWTIHGEGAVTVYRHNGVERYGAGNNIPLRIGLHTADRG